MATKVVNDLVTKFSFAGPLAPLAKYNSLLGTSIGKLGLWTAAIAGGIALIDKWAHGVLTGVDSLDALAYQTRQSVAEIQEWNYMAEQNQSTASAMQSTLLSLGNAIGSAAQRGSEDFARLGISVRDANGHIKTAGQVLNEVHGRFRSLGLSIEEQRNFASALGIDPSLLRLLNQSSAELAELRNQAQQFGTLTDTQAKQAANYAKSVKALSFGMDSLRNIIAVGLAPEMERMASGFGKLLRENRDWIVEGLQAATKWMGRVWDMFERTLPYLVPFAAGIAAIKLAFVGLNGVLKAGLIVGLLLALDDLIVAFQGGKSVIADFFEQEFGVDIVKELTTAFRELSEAIDTAFGWLRDFFGFLNRQGAETGKALVNLGLPEAIETTQLLIEKPAEGFARINPLDEAGRALGAGVADITSWFKSFGGTETDVPAPVLRPSETDVPAPVLRPSETDVPAPVLRPSETDVPAPVLRPSETDVPAPILRPSETDVPAPILRPSETDVPAPILRPSETDVPAPILRPSETDVPAPVAESTAGVLSILASIDLHIRDIAKSSIYRLNPFANQPPPAPEMATTNRTLEQSNTFNVYTSDARAAARLTLDGLDRQLDNADTQLAVGGL